MEEYNNAIEVLTLTEWLNKLSDKFQRNSTLKETLFAILEFGELFHESFECGVLSGNANSRLF